MIERSAIDLPDEAHGEKAFAAVRVLEAFATNATSGIAEDVQDRVASAVQYYPSFGGETINIAQRQEWDDRLGRADPLNRIVYLPVEHTTSYITIFHELEHISIHLRNKRGEDVPVTSEEYCSLSAVSRMPPQYIDEDRIPYFGAPDIPREQWPDVCQKALDYREDHHAYISQAEEWLGTES